LVRILTCSAQKPRGGTWFSLALFPRKGNGIRINRKVEANVFPKNFAKKHGSRGDIHGGENTDFREKATKITYMGTYYTCMIIPPPLHGGAREGWGGGDYRPSWRFPYIAKKFLVCDAWVCT
jgi:hypothetical protein